MVLLALALLPLATSMPVHEGHLHHYEYVFPDSSIYVYDIDNSGALVKHVSVPTSAGVRGAVASAVTGMLYISYGNDRRSGGSMLKYNLMTDEVVWVKRYSFGVDSMSISPDGNTIYMPTGELASGGIWKVIDASSGNVTASIDSGGTGPHNTVVSPDGARVYLGPRHSNYLVVADTGINQVIRKIGPVGGVGGVRPFTINGAQSLAFITLTGFLGFQVGDISTGKILYTVPVQGFPTTGRAVSAPSHGISLSPDEKEIYLMDSINSYVHVFDVTALPGSAPRQVADIQLVGTVSGRERPCAYDCLRDGWLHHSRNGRYVFVGDSGDVIDTTLRKTAMTLPALANSRKAIEINFEDSVPLPIWAMNNRSSIGDRLALGILNLAGLCPVLASHLRKKFSVRPVGSVLDWPAPFFGCLMDSDAELCDRMPPWSAALEPFRHSFPWLNPLARGQHRQRNGVLFSARLWERTNQPASAQFGQIHWNNP